MFQYKIKVFKKEKKKNIIKVARENRFIYKGTLIRLSADFSAQTLQGGKEWHEIFKVLKQKQKNPAT